MSRIKFPHCDSRILHAPKDCVYCDKHPLWQELRIVWNIAFTGRYEAGKTPCPAMAARPETYNKWHGNVAMTKEDIERENQYWQDAFKDI